LEEGEQGDSKQGEMKVEGTGENGRSGRLSRRLKGMQRRKRARCGLDCEVMVQKLKLVKIEEGGDLYLCLSTAMRKFAPG